MSAVRISLDVKSAIAALTKLSALADTGELSPKAIDGLFDLDGDFLVLHTLRLDIGTLSSPGSVRMGIYPSERLLRLLPVLRAEGDDFCIVVHRHLDVPLSSKGEGL